MDQNLKKAVIIVAVHKKYRMPDDPLYLPLHVGAEGKKDKKGDPLDLGYVKDNTGDNISEKNGSYCELTGLYWAWKNLDADYIGLAHYRRHFAGSRKGKDPFDRVLTGQELEKDIPQIRLFLPKKRNYYIETLYSHYAHTHYAEQLDTVREIISAQCPEYLKVYDRVIKRTSGYMFNMMIMDRELLDHYCSWLFPILSELEKSKAASRPMSFYQGRFYGRVSEIIFNVWLEKLLEDGKIKKEEIKVLPYLPMEKTHWIKKGGSFLKAKFFKKRYKGSF